jgi:ribosome recycling factor
MKLRFLKREKLFEVEVDETQGDPVVEDKSKQEEVKDEEEPKEDSKNKYSKSVQKRFDEYAYQLGESRRREEEAIQNCSSY